MTVLVEVHEGYVVAYTDGSCLFNGQAGASSGIGVFWGPNDPRCVWSKIYVQPSVSCIQHNFVYGSTVLRQRKKLCLLSTKPYVEWVASYTVRKCYSSCCCCVNPLLQCYASYKTGYYIPEKSPWYYATETIVQYSKFLYWMLTFVYCTRTPTQILSQ